MKYTVLWSPNAERELTALWTASGNRRAITGAAHEIDTLLKENPEQQGESREAGRRILLIPPLGIKFRVRTDDRIALVLSVWQFAVRHEE